MTPFRVIIKSKKATDMKKEVFGILSKAIRSS